MTQPRTLQERHAVVLKLRQLNSEIVQVQDEHLRSNLVHTASKLGMFALDEIDRLAAALDAALLETSNIPDGYILGLSRRKVPRAKTSHLYKGTFSNPGQPMCKRGYEAAGDYSIWRGNIGENGICGVCLWRARAGLEPAPWPTEQSAQGKTGGVT